MKFFSEAGAAAERIKEVIKRVPRIDSESEEGEILERVYGEVEFDRVEFAYPSRPESAVLNGLSVRIPAGKRVALVGESGSGKSTVIALLQRFYDPVGGEVRLDGVGIQKLQVKWMRSQMGLVSQEPALFATTIKENILFGREDATEDQVVEAAKAAHAHDFISLLPHGYQTQVIPILFLSYLYSPNAPTYLINSFIIHPTLFALHVINAKVPPPSNLLPIPTLYYSCIIFYIFLLPLASLSL